MIRSPQHLSGVCVGGGAADAPFQNFLINDTFFKKNIVLFKC